MLYPDQRIQHFILFRSIRENGNTVRRNFRDQIDNPEYSAKAEKAKNADLIITGEGKLDSQSLMGKVPFCVAQKSENKRVIALVGVSEVSAEKAKEKGISLIIETNPLHLPFEEIRYSAGQMLIAATENIIV